MGSGTAEFTVLVTYDSLGALTRRFVKQEGVGKALTAKLDAARASAARGGESSKAGQIEAYIHQLEAQSSKVLTAEQAAILIQLAQAL